MGQQFYVIRNNLAPGTAAAKAKAERDRLKADRRGATATATVEAGTDSGPAAGAGGAAGARRPAQRQQPRKQSREQRKKTGGARPATDAEGGTRE
jgi:YidC/Oxa1 family membrane protein insertase